MSISGRSRIACLLLLLGFLMSGLLYIYQQSPDKIVFKNIYFSINAQQSGILPLNNTQYQNNISSSNITSSRNATLFETVSPQFVSFDDTAYDGRRLGNQLFNFAAVLFVAELSGRRPVLKISTKKLQLEQIFQLNLEKVDNLCPCHTIGETHHLSYYQNTENENLEDGNNSILVGGYRQSWKYTTGIEQSLRRHLVFQNEIKRFAEDFLHSNTPPGWKKVGFVRVGIHVRRGDILKVSQYIWHGYTVPIATYFKKAMKFFIERYVRVQFITTSDDRDWTISNIVTPINISTAVVNVTHSLDHTAGQDLAILSLCDHVIMSTGTFGWWGAWLAKGTTIYYKDWPRPGSPLSGHLKKEDFFPPSWIAVGD